MLAGMSAPQPLDPHDVGAILDNSYGVFLRPGQHCAPYIHRRLGTFPLGTLRVSPGPFNTTEQIDLFIHALDEIASSIL